MGASWRLAPNERCESTRRRIFAIKTVPNRRSSSARAVYRPIFTIHRLFSQNSFVFTPILPRKQSFRSKPTKTGFQSEEYGFSKKRLRKSCNFSKCIYRFLMRLRRWFIRTMKSMTDRAEVVFYFFRENESAFAVDTAKFALLSISAHGSSFACAVSPRECLEFLVPRIFREKLP